MCDLEILDLEMLDHSTTDRQSPNGQCSNCSGTYRKSSNRPRT
jgi:hypothetical protein